MFCKKCGCKLEDGAAVCPNCGAPVKSPSGDVLQDALNTQPPAYAGPAADHAPASGGRGPELEAPKKGKGWIVLTAAACVAVACVLAVVLLGGMFSGAKGTLTNAMTKSVDAWQAAADSLDLPDLSKLYEEQQFGQRMTVQLKDISEQFGQQAQMLEGLSFTMSEELNIPERKLEMSVGANYGAAELLTARINGNDSVFSLSCPALLGEQTYGINTETLGQDITRLYPESAEDVENISFNFFDIVEAYAKPMQVNEKAHEALNDAIEVKKTGTSTMDINGASLKCDAYRVTVPQEAMLTYLDAVRAAYNARELNEVMLELMRSFGASEADLEEMEDQLRNVDMFEELEEFLEDAGSLELNVYVNDGYVAAVIWKGVGESLSLYFGGGENYADDLSLEIQTGDGRVSLKSSGHHSASGGAFTDTTSLLVESSNTRVSLESQLSYDPQLPSDNFSWTISSDGVALAASGQLTSTKDELYLDLDNVSVRVLGEEYAVLGLFWQIHPCAEITPDEPLMLGDMTTDDLETLYYDVTINSQNWVMNLANEVPELFQLFM